MGSLTGGTDSSMGFQDVPKLGQDARKIRGQFEEDWPFTSETNRRAENAGRMT